MIISPQNRNNLLASLHRGVALRVLCAVVIGLLLLSIVPLASAASMQMPSERPASSPVEPSDIPKLQKHLTKTAKAKGVQLELPMKEEEETYVEEPSPRLPVTLAKVIVYGAVFIITFILILTFIRHRRLKTVKLAEMDLMATKSGSMGKLQKALEIIREDADKLAAKGEFSQAMHELLIKGLEEYKKREAKKMRSSYTSRELLLILPMSQDETEAFADLVRRVELVYFGNSIPGSSDYEESKLSYARLINTLKANREILRANPAAPSGAIGAIGAP
jgi:hypothetical protein